MALGVRLVAVICTIIVVVLSVLYGTGILMGEHHDGGTRNRIRRWSTTPVEDWTWKDLDETQNHPFETNMWYRYAKVLAKSYGKSNCYVCSQMPHSSSHLTLYATPLPWKESECFYRAAARKDPKSLFLRAKSPELFIKALTNLTGNASDYYVETTCEDTPFTPLNLSIRGKPEPHRVIIKPSALPECRRPSGDVVRAFPFCVMGSDKANVLGSLSYDVCCSVIQPHGPLTGDAVEGAWWLCGSRAYPSLPAKWTGLCAPIRVSDHTFIAELSGTPIRNKRDLRSVYPTFKPHDDKWGSDVPDEFKHWNTASKIALCLFAPDGVAKNMLRLETVDYRFQTWVNATIVVDEGQNREIDATRTMVLQNRMVLDLLTASEGGVCVKIGTTCCTYIPDEVNTNVSAALQVMKNLREAMGQDQQPSEQGDWLAWVLSGVWWHKLVMGCILVGGFYIFFLCFLSCILPCIRALFNKAVNSALVTYTSLGIQTTSGRHAGMEPDQVYGELDSDTGVEVNYEDTVV